MNYYSFIVIDNRGELVCGAYQVKGYLLEIRISVINTKSE